MLTSTKQCYANNERELLTCIFGAECFQTYMFLVDTSQSRVPQITKTDLHEESGRCPSTSTEDVTQTSGLWFHNQVLPRRGNGCSRHLIKILTWEYTRDSPRHFCQPYIHWCWEKWDYQLTIKDDPLLSVLTDMIITGWPDDIRDVPKALWPFHGQYDSLTVEDGLILCIDQSFFPQEKGRSWNKSIKNIWAH